MFAIEFVKFFPTNFLKIEFYLNNFVAVNLAVIKKDCNTFSFKSFDEFQ